MKDSGNITHKRTKSADAKLQQIAKVAATLFCEKGFTETTVRDISKACNISMGHLYYYIKSKDDFPVIFSDIHLRHISKWENAVRKQMSRRTPEASFRYAIRKYMMLIHERRKMLLFWYRVSKSLKPEQLKGVIESEIMIVEVFKQILDEGNQKGQFQVVDPYLTAFQIEVLCHTWILKRWYLRNLYTINQFMDVCEDNLVSMVRRVSK